VDEGIGSLNDDGDAVVISINEPVEGHGPVTCCGVALELWATPALLSVDKVALAKRFAPMRTLLLRFVVAAVFFAIADVALAMTALEFLRAEADFKEAPIMREIETKLVAKGYKNVPDWRRLSRITRQKILEKGYTTQDIEAIAEEAALAAGMTR
jgi:hypothetical protein